LGWGLTSETQAISQGDSSTLETVVARAQKDGFSLDTLASASSVLETLKREDQVAKDLVEAMGLGDIAALAEGLDLAKELEDFAKRNHYTHEKVRVCRRRRRG
jgi:hypothetical protein